MTEHERLLLKLICTGTIVLPFIIMGIIALVKKIAKHVGPGPEKVFCNECLNIQGNKCLLFIEGYEDTPIYRTIIYGPCEVKNAVNTCSDFEKNHHDW